MKRETMLELISIATENMSDEELAKVLEFIVNEPVTNEPSTSEPDKINESNAIICKAPDCNNQFIPTHNLNTYCSKKCSDRVRNKKQRERRKRLKKELNE